jgi:phage repressor protein C with HTH and peptisase S24 domain
MIVKGNSMEPKFESGDEIACKKVEKIIEWGKTYVLATRDGAVLKRLYQDEDGVRCVSYNHEEYPDFHVDGDDILGVYRVVGLLRV